MKKLHFIAVSLLMVLGCSETDEPQIIQRIDEIFIFDVGNEGDITDMRVVFTVSNVGRIGEYRVLVVPDGIIGSFDKKKALLLTPDRYRSVEISTSERYSLRLDTQLDVEGNEVLPGQPYVVKVLMLGERFNQLSIIQSNTLTLTTEGIYSGFYSGILVHNVSGPGRFLPSGQTRMEVIRGRFNEASGNTYQASVTTQTQGNFGNFNTFEGSIRMTLIDDIVTEFEVSGSLIPYLSTFRGCNDQNSGVITGVIKNDLQLQVQGENCENGLFELLMVRARP